MKRKKMTDDPIHRSLVFLVLRFVVFLLIALTISAPFETDRPVILWAAFGYFALSEILLLVRSSSKIKQGIAVGIYFLDVYAVSYMILIQGISVLWYLSIPALMLGVGLCYNRRGAWFPIALIPSVLILYQDFYATDLSAEWGWQILGVIFLFFVFAGIVYSVATRIDRVLSLYLGQRKMVSGISDVTPSHSLKECVREILEKEPPIALDFYSVLLSDPEGNLRGLERAGTGEIGKVLLANQRIPSVFKSIEKAESYFPDIGKERTENPFLKTRKVGGLLGHPIRIGEMKGLVLFGRKGKNVFSDGEREILAIYAEMVSGWMHQSYAYEEQEADAQRVVHEPAGKGEPLKEEVKEEEASRMAERLRILEEENRQLKQTLDEQVHSATLELKNAVLSMMTRESESDQQVFEKLASVELSQAVSMLFDLDLILDLILERVCAKLSVRTASIMLVREDKGDLVIRAHRGMEDELARKVRLMIGEAIAGYVAEKGEPLLIEDIEKDPRFVPFRRDRYRSGTLLSVPIIHEKSVFGVINLSDPVREGPFEDRDLEVLQALSRQAALAIVNHRLYQEFENGQWIKEFYEEGLAQKLSEKVFQDAKVLDKIEGKYRVSILSVRLHEDDVSRKDGDIEERIRRIEGTLQSVREIVVRSQGSIAGDTGSGLVGIFGLPFPDEKAPWRAVLTAVNLLKTFARLAQDPSSNGSRFGISVGVASGELLFREKKGAAPFAVFGEPWERAVTLMQAGSPGQVLVDEETFERIRSGVNGLRLTLPYGINKQLTVYGIKGLRRKNAAG